MSIPRAASLALTVFVVALASSACEENGFETRIGAPSAFDSDARFINRGVSVQPTLVDAQIVAGAFCPTHPPFLAPVNLIFGADAGGLSLSRVQMQFVDRTGISGGSMTITRPELVARFGSTFIPALGTRTFPLTFPFGCIGLPTGMLTIVVFAEDSQGRESRTALEVGVRAHAH